MNFLLMIFNKSTFEFIKKHFFTILLIIVSVMYYFSHNHVLKLEKEIEIKKQIINTLKIQNDKEIKIIDENILLKKNELHKRLEKYENI